MNDFPPPASLSESLTEELQRQPYLYLRLTENALTVADSLRNNYFKNTAQFVTDLRRSVRRAAAGDNPVMSVASARDTKWADLQNEVVTFIDGGVGTVEISSQVPILLRVGSYCVRTGERRISQREQFGYYPIVLGDLEGGSRDRPDFIDIVRITAELLGGLSALERTKDLRVLMFHGPLIYLVGGYAGHSPFTEADIDLFLSRYAADPALGRTLKEQFLDEARKAIYPKMGQPRWAERRLFDPLAWMAFLYRRLVACASERSPRPIIAGVVERGRSTEFSDVVLLENVFRNLRQNRREDYFNALFGRSDLLSPRAVLDRLGYTDALLLAMILQPGEYSEPWNMQKFTGLRRGEVAVGGDSERVVVDFSALKPGGIGGFPRVTACYLQVTKNTEPVRIEVFTELGHEQVIEAVCRVYLYSGLLPGYGFPVGLDIADKYAKVPAWLTSAYGKLIRHHLGVSLQKGEISDEETRRLLTQAIYMTHRDWLFRPHQ